MSFKQVQLRGGTSDEHNGFIGAPREITIDTTKNTIRVHDGYTNGGHIICTEESLNDETSRLDKRIDDMQNNLGGSHNHDDRYSKLTHNHDDIYLKKVEGCNNILIKRNGTYPGFCHDDGNDAGWVRTTTSGLLPYQNGGYSAIGSSSWRFANGWFNNVDSDVVYAKQIQVPGGDTRNQIKFGNNDYISYNDGTNEFDFLADDSLSNSRVRVGRIETQGRRIYIQSSKPTDARTGDIWFAI